MKNEKRLIDRRHFLKGTSVLCLLGLGSSSLLSVPDSCGEQKGKRESLRVPGPMIPPVPAILLTVNGLKDEPDEISVLWTFVINGKPAQIGVSADHHHRAGGLIKKHREFVLNVPIVSMVKHFDTVDMNSSKVMDKFKLSGLTRGKGSKVDAPTIQESPIHLECRVTHVIDVPPSRTVFLADVVCTAVLPGICDEKGRLQVEKTPIFGMTAGSGEFYTMGKRVGQIGQTVGRTDIKY